MHEAALAASKIVSQSLPRKLNSTSRDPPPRRHELDLLSGFPAFPASDNSVNTMDMLTPSKLYLAVTCTFLLLASHVKAHPTIHTSFDPSDYTSRGQTPPFQSYHLHVQYIKDGDVSNRSAFALRSAFMDHFNISDEVCSGLFEQPHMCIYEVVNHEGGIFVSGNWAAYIPLQRYQEAVEWVAQHRKDPMNSGGVALDCMFHPNTNEYLHDHFRWSTWAGRAWPLNDEAFSDYGNYTTDKYCDHWECF